MNIYFSPVSSVVPVELLLEVQDGSIVINGSAYALADLAAIDPAEGGQYPPFVCGADSESVTIALHYFGCGSEAVRHPDPIMDAQDGLVGLPK